MNSLVSVIIPAFNASAYIGRTIESVRRQTHANLEIIIVNDGSTDDTAEIAAKAAASDHRIRLVTTPNGGVAAARNKGIDLCAGDYIAFVDADDLWHPTKIEKQVAALERLPSVWGAVYTLHQVINQRDAIIRPGGSRIARGYIFSRHLVFKYVGNGSTLMIRRDVAREIGGFDSSYAASGIGGCEDLDFELRVAARYLVEVVPERLVGYREYPGNMSSNYSRMALGLLETVRRAMKAMPGLPAPVVDAALLAAHEFALVKFLQSRNFPLALTSAVAIARSNPLLVAKIAARKVVGYLRYRLTLVRREGLVDTRLPTLFQDQEETPPVPAVAESGPTARLLERLAVADAELCLIRNVAEPGEAKQPATSAMAG